MSRTALTEDEEGKKQLAVWVPVSVMDKLNKISKNVSLDRTHLIQEIILYLDGLDPLQQIKLLRNKII